MFASKRKNKEVESCHFPHTVCMDGISMLEQYRVVLREQISVPLCMCTASVCTCNCGCLEPIHLSFAPGLSQPNADSKAGCGY